MGNRHAVYAPHGAYRCRGDDSWVTIAVGSNRQWHDLCDVMGSPDLADDPRFAGILARRRNHDPLDEIISGWTRDRDPHEVMNALQARGVASAPVLSGEGIFGDPHYQERGLLELVDHPSTGPYLMPGVAWKMSMTPGEIRWPAPRLGEHNDFVYGELLARTRSEIAALRSQGVIGTVPDGMGEG